MLVRGHPRYIPACTCYPTAPSSTPVRPRLQRSLILPATPGGRRAETNYGGNRGYGTSVLLPLTPENNYDPRVMILGGGNPATNSDRDDRSGRATPTWQNSAIMSQARTEMNAVILPTWAAYWRLGGSVNDEEVAFGQPERRLV